MKTTTWIYRLCIASTVIVFATACTKLPQPATPTAPIKESQIPAGNVSDVDVTEHVKMALVQDEVLNAFTINVITLNGDVRLTGTLDSQVQIDQAIKIARNAAGAHTVHDELSLKK